MNEQTDGGREGGRREGGRDVGMMDADFSCGIRYRRCQCGDNPQWTRLAFHPGGGGG